MIFLLGNMGLVDVDYILRFWPVILIAVGIFRFVEYGEDYQHSSGIFWIVVGGLFLLGSLGMLRIAFRDLWPVVLIGLGALMMWRWAYAGRETRDSRDDRADRATNTFAAADSSAPPRDEGPPASDISSDSIISAMAVLGSVSRRNNCQDFRGGSATAFLGGCEVDLRGASITKPHEPVLEVFAMWGGIELRVPPDWTVVSHVDPIMGGFEDATQPPKDGSKRLVVRGSVVMGGIEVTN